MKNRWGTLLALVIIAPILMGSGGFNPPSDTSKTVGPAVSATIVIDPHVDSGRAGQGAIRLQKGLNVSGGLFTMAPGTRGLLFTNFGCDAARTDTRFVNARLTDLGIHEDTVAQMFADLGITVTGSNVPVITDTDAAVCTFDISDPTPGAMNPGILSFQAVIQFTVPATGK